MVVRRRGERAWALAHPGPRSYGTPPPPPPVQVLPAPARRSTEAFLWSITGILGDVDAVGREGPGLVTGVGASAGTARVVLDESEFGKIRAGDVLVCPATSPVWSVLFPSIGALVTNSGGTLSHPAIIAREYGIPAVVDTKVATTALRDGQLVTVDGDSGVVHVVR
ncbi:PEP-utilizing enzyme [Georgenia sp. AZ-5]|uniref:PEP-utilizing enzyme n=1 Tax=Georgenia sp. AZ-5 TaxID=3367526 RepID=UPI0037550690